VAVFDAWFYDRHVHDAMAFGVPAHDVGTQCCLSVWIFAPAQMQEPW